MGEQADWEITKEIYGLDDDDILDFFRLVRRRLYGLGAKSSSLNKKYKI